jgi:hypothetical protein
VGIAVAAEIAQLQGVAPARPFIGGHAPESILPTPFAMAIVVTLQMAAANARLTLG